MDHPQIHDTIISCSLLLAIMLILSHFWTASENWVKYYQGVNLELLKCEIDLIFFECPGRCKKLLIQIIKRFISVANCNRFLTHVYLINNSSMLNHICKVEKITGYKTLKKKSSQRIRKYMPRNREPSQRALLAIIEKTGLNVNL